MEQYCSICGKRFIGLGKTARPINEGRCCSICYSMIVAPRRIVDQENKIRRQEHDYSGQV